MAITSTPSALSMDERITGLEIAALWMLEQKAVSGKKPVAEDDGTVNCCEGLKCAIELLKQQLEAITIKNFYLERQFADAMTSIVADGAWFCEGRVLDSPRHCEPPTTPTEYMDPYGSACGGPSEFPQYWSPPGLESQNGYNRAWYEKRQQIIDSIKKEPIYMEYKAILDRGGKVNIEVPATPDPGDETISKRTWESEVSKWRGALREVSSQLRNECDPVELADP